jgi:hypothetical protein
LASTWIDICDTESVEKITVSMNTGNRFKNGSVQIYSEKIDGHQQERDKYALKETWDLSANTYPKHFPDPFSL